MTLTALENFFLHKAYLVERAPYNDWRLFRLLNDYTCNKVVRDATMAAFKRHLWYFSEHLVGLAFLSPCVDVHTKASMVKNLKRAEKKKSPKSIEGETFNLENPLKSYVTS